MLFGMVMLLKPMVPLCPVNVNDNFVIELVWLVAIVAFVIWGAVMFPLIVKLSVEPLLAVACRVAAGLGVGVGLAVGVGTGVGEAVGVEVKPAGVGVGGGVGGGESGEPIKA